MRKRPDLVVLADGGVGGHTVGKNVRALADDGVRKDHALVDARAFADVRGSA